MSPYYWHLVFLTEREKIKLGKDRLAITSGKYESRNIRGVLTALQLLINFIRFWADCPGMNFAPVWA